MKIAISYFVIIRILIGALFAVSGLEKLISPYQNFLYVVQSYTFLSPVFEEIVARLLPWAELLLGVFTILGCGLRRALPLLGCLIMAFIVVVAQALIRGLPISECGCFGDLISFPPHVTILFDVVLLALTALLMKRIDSASLFSIDHHFDKS